MTLNPGTRLGPYEVVAPLGAGGMGEVYRARDTRLRREVAIKVLPPHMAESGTALARFEREAQAVAALAHPNIVAIFDFGREQAVTYAVMELLEGESLRARVQTGPVPPRTAVDYALQVARGLAAAHAKGIIHRDLKPGNLFVTSFDLVKILDFGLARVEDEIRPEQEPTTTSMMTAPGALLGTPGYMAPEQVRGEQADVRTDIFALGAILYEMLLGERAFAAASVPEMLSAILKEEPRGLAQVERNFSPALARLLRRCMAKKAEERFQNAQDLSFALEAVLEWSGAPREARQEQPGTALSIAVLPFANMSPDPDTEYFSDGMSEEIINALAHLPGLRVAARTSSFAFKGKSEDLRAIGQKLGVGSVLEGSVRRAGNRLRITAQLIDAREGHHLWSERYDRDLNDVFAIQDEIAQDIASRLKVTLAPVPGAASGKFPTTSLEAYDLYLKGRFCVDKREMGRALEHFERAVVIDPRFALAHAELAGAYSLLSFLSLARPRDAMPKARAAAEKALSLDSSLGHAYWASATVSMLFDRDWQQADKLFRQALLLQPSDSLARGWYAVYLAYIARRPDEALQHAKLGESNDPLAGWPKMFLGMVLLALRRFGEARAKLQELVELEPLLWTAQRMLGVALYCEGRLEDAIAVFETAMRLSKGHPWLLAERAEVLAECGRPEEAEAVYRELTDRSRRQWVPPTTIGVLAGVLGKDDEAFALLERAVVERESVVCVWREWPGPGTKRLRCDPRWEALLKRAGL